jgi:hypothetical protein
MEFPATIFTQSISTSGSQQAARANHDVLAADGGGDRRRIEDVTGHHAQRRIGPGQLRAIADDVDDVMAAIECLAQDPAADHPGGTERAILAINASPKDQSIPRRRLTRAVGALPARGRVRAGPSAAGSRLW